MKTIGIIAAMEEELATLKSKLEIKVTKRAIETEFYIGSLLGKSVILVKSGVGKVNAATCAQVLIDLFAVDYIINTGVAGGIHSDLKIGDLVISKDAVQHDFDCSVCGTAKGEIPYINKSAFEADAVLIEYAKKAAEELGIYNNRKVFVARIATGDVFVDSKEKKKEVWSISGGYCTEMEGAAIAQVCYLNKIPFVIIRAISDNADGSGNSDFKAFLANTAKMSSSIAEKIVEYI